MAYRLRDGQAQFCLITSLKKRVWGFPKGIIEPHQSLAEAAQQEAYEEAGVVGIVVGEPLGSYADYKWNRDLRVTGVLYEVLEELDTWPEAELRQRAWHAASDALATLGRKEQRELLRTALERLK